MYVATGEPNVKWRGTDFKIGEPGTTGIPAGDDPAANASINIACFAKQTSCQQDILGEDWLHFVGFCFQEIFCTFPSSLISYLF